MPADENSAYPFEETVSAIGSNWTLSLEICGFVLLGSDALVSDVDVSITSTFGMTDVAFLYGAKLFDVRVVWDSRVRFRLGDECSEADVDVI